GRDAVNAAGFRDLGAGGARDFVVGGFLGLLADVAGRVGLGRLDALTLIARQFVVDGDLVVAAVGAGTFFLAGLARPQHAPLGVEAVGGLRHLVEVEVSGEFDARPARADHLRDDGLDLAAQPLLERRTALVGAGPLANFTGQA